MESCTSPHTDNDTNIPPLSFLQARCRPTNSDKALKVLSIIFIIVVIIVIIHLYSMLMTIFQVNLS